MYEENNTTRKFIVRALLVIIVIAVIFSAIVVPKRNEIVTLHENVKLYEAQVQSTLQRRCDLIPNLVNTVKGYTNHEEEVFTEIAKSREKLNECSNMEEMQEFNNELTQKINEVFVIVENYPELKASEHYTTLMYELAGTENRINIARREYNEAVATYNTKIRMFPYTVWAKVYNYTELPYFEASTEAQEAPVVNFE